MTLPEAKQQAIALHAEGEALLREHDFIAKLSKIGYVRIEGSFAYNLLAYPDIDFDVRSVGHPSRDKIAKLVSELIAKTNFPKVSFSDKYVTPPKAGKPEGIWLGVKLLFRDRLWKLDIWFLREDQDKYLTGDPARQVHNASSGERDAIIFIKANAVERGLYANPIGSMDIYRAVLKDGVTTIEELLAWHKTHK